MYGLFESVSDVIRNKLREEINLHQRQTIIEEILGLSHPTVNKYSASYSRFADELLEKSGFRVS